jgi:hypothetical protein
VKSAERVSNDPQKLLRFAIAGLLAGAALEDALRRLCDAKQIAYDAQRTTIAKLQGAYISRPTRSKPSTDRRISRSPQGATPGTKLITGSTLS